MHDELANNAKFILLTEATWERPEGFIDPPDDQTNQENKYLALNIILRIGCTALRFYLVILMKQIKL
jgi:hypothetical protein